MDGTEKTQKNTVGVLLDSKSAGNAFVVLVLNGKVVRNVIIDENPRYLFEIQLRYRHSTNISISQPTG